MVRSLKKMFLGLARHTKYELNADIGKSCVHIIWTQFMHSNVLPKKERLWAQKHGLEVAYILANALPRAGF